MGILGHDLFDPAGLLHFEDDPVELGQEAGLGGALADHEVERHGVEGDVGLDHVGGHAGFADVGPGGHGPLYGDVAAMHGQHAPDALYQRGLVDLDAA